MYSKRPDALGRLLATLALPLNAFTGYVVLTNVANAIKSSVLIVGQTLRQILTYYHGLPTKLKAAQ